jgi:hypothetical protein
VLLIAGPSGIGPMGVVQDISVSTRCDRARAPGRDRTGGCRQRASTRQGMSMRHRIGGRLWERLRRWLPNPVAADSRSAAQGGLERTARGAG